MPYGLFFYEIVSFFTIYDDVLFEKYVPSIPVRNMIADQCQNLAGGRDRWTLILILTQELAISFDNGGIDCLASSSPHMVGYAVLRDGNRYWGELCIPTLRSASSRHLLVSLQLTSSFLHENVCINVFYRNTTGNVFNPLSTVCVVHTGNITTF